jgi:predicted  nucleic acid-binding Zn-ribbon protein
MMGYISGGLGIALLIMCGIFKVYFDRSQEQITDLTTQLETSKQNQLKLEDEIKEQNDNLEKTIANHEMIVGQMEKMTVQNQEFQAEADRLKKKFSEHDLQHLALRRPDSINRLINAATQKVAKEFSALTDPNTL